MRGLDRLAWRILRARPLRAALTILGIALGVGVLTASLTMSAGLQAAVDRTVRDAVGRADLRVSAFLEGGLSAAAVDAIRSTPGVEAVAPTIERRTFLAPPLGSAPGDAVTVLGIDPAPYLRVHDLPLASGSQLATQDEPSAIVTESLAASDHYALGDRITLQGAGDPATLRIVGILAGGGPVASSGGRTVIVPIAIARSVFAVDGVSHVDVLTANGTATSSVVAGIATRLTTEPYVVASPADMAASLRASTADFEATMALVAAIVLFVGSFLIVNTLSMTVGERAREVGLLRAAGATRAQVVRFVLVGALILGAVGSAIGIAIGAGLGLVVAGSVRALSGIAGDVPGLDLGSAALALAVGIAVTVLAAIEPAVRAARISPVEALRARLDIPTVRRARLGWIALVFVGVAILALLAWPASAASGAGRALVVYAILLAVTLVSPFLLPPLARVVGRPLAAVLRLEERLARGSLQRDRGRTALTLGSLAVGLALIIALGWTADAARRSATAWLQDVIPGDEVVSSIRPIAPSEGVREALTAVPGVLRATPIATFDLAYRGVRIDAAAIVGGDFLADGRLRKVSGDLRSSLGALDRGGVAILPAATADRLGLRVGDTMSLALSADRRLDLSVGAIVERSIPGSGGEAVLVGWPDATNAIGVKGADVFAVRFQPGAADQARPALQQAATGLALQANPLDRIQGAVTAALGRVFGIFDALALIAVLIGALGIVNTLTMGVVERVREIGVLRAIGMSRRQTSRMVVIEATVLGLVGIVIGTLAGLLMGAVLLALTGGLTPSVGIPWAPIGIAAALGLAGPAIAAYYPSRLASRLSIVRALQFE